MKEIKKKVSKILLSLTMILTMALVTMPTKVHAAGTPSATISDVTVSGYTNVNIPKFTTPYSATLTLQNAQFMFLGNKDVTAYCEGVPSGMTVNIETTRDDFSIGTVTFYGTPTEISNAPIKITLPGDQDLSIIYPFGKDVTITVNPNANWDIQKNNLDDAKPLAKSAIDGLTATNDTEAIDILDAVTNSISSVTDVTVSWKAEPTIVLATKNMVGSIKGTIILTYKSLTTEVIINKTIAKLPKTDKEKIEEAKPLAETAISELVATNNTTAANILDAVTNSISSVDGVIASWKVVPTITPATRDNAGAITGTLVLTCGSETVDISVDKTIAQLSITDKDKLDEAKPLAESAIATIIATNDTTATNILDAVTNGISSVNGVTTSWKVEPTIIKATSNNAGAITGTIVLTSGSETVEVTVNKLIEQLPTPEKPIISAGNNGTNHQINSGKDMSFTCSGKLEDLTGIYVDDKLVEKNDYTLKSGSTILTLNASYLDTLSAGKHTLKFQYKDNVFAETAFTITAKNENPSLPQTGDITNTMPYLVLIVFSGCGVVFGLKKKKIIK